MSMALLLKKFGVHQLPAAADQGSCLRLLMTEEVGQSLLEVINKLVLSIQHSAAII